MQETNTAASSAHRVMSYLVNPRRTREGYGTCFVIRSFSHSVNRATEISAHFCKSVNTSTIDSVIDDSIFDEGDQHARQITIGPQASMMTVENPESIISVAPAEGQKPLSIMTDASFEAMSNPDKFCYGDGVFSTDRSRKLTYRRYFNQRLLDVDGRFARDLDSLFVAQYIVEANQVSGDANNFIW